MRPGALTQAARVPRPGRATPAPAAPLAPRAHRRPNAVAGARHGLRRRPWRPPRYRPVAAATQSRRTARRAGRHAPRPGTAAAKSRPLDRPPARPRQAARPRQRARPHTRRLRDRLGRVAAAVALPLRRPFIGREPAPRPARCQARPTPEGEAAAAGDRYRTGLAAFVRSLPDHALLDRVVRGRAWIPVLGVMLAGIVAMQVEVLKLGASIGRSLESSAALQVATSCSRTSVASLADDQRIERLAAAWDGHAPPDAVGFLGGWRRNVNGALAGIHAPERVRVHGARALQRGARDRRRDVDAADELGGAGAGGDARKRHADEHAQPDVDGPLGGNVHLRHVRLEHREQRSDREHGIPGPARRTATPGLDGDARRPQTSDRRLTDTSGGAQSTMAGRTGAQTTDPQSSTTEPQSTTGAAAIQPGTSTGQQGTGG